MADSFAGPCPPDAVWDEIALGSEEGGRHADLLDHAAVCSKCGKKLSLAVELYKGEAFPGETDWVAAAVARHSAPMATALPAPSPNWRAWGAVAASIAVVATGLAWLTLRDSPGDVTSGPRLDEVMAVMARDYSVTQPTPLRLQNSPYVPGVPAIRNQGNRGLSPEFYEARAEIGRQLCDGCDRLDPRWSFAQGRFHIVSGEAEEAVETLEAVRDRSGDSPELLIELGVAYYSRAVDAGSRSDYEIAYELTNQALALAPGNLAALFNRAYILEAMELKTEALEAWEQYCDLDQEADGWRPIAVERRDELRALIGFLFSPERALEVRRLAEERLELFLRGELSKVEGASSLPGLELADELLTRHSDGWLGELLQSSPGDAELVPLRRAARNRRTVSVHKYGEIEPQLRSQQFDLAPATVAWRDFELIYALSHTRPGEDCAELASGAIERARKRKYTWLLAHSLLDYSSCLINLGREAQAAVAIAEAIELAERSDYPVVEVRARGFQASHLVNHGRYREALEIVATQIPRIERERLPVLRMHQFYNETRRVGELTGRLHTALAGSLATAGLSRKLGAEAQELVLRAMAAEYADELGEYDEVGTQVDMIKSLEERVRGDAKGGIYEVFAAERLAVASGDLALLRRLDGAIRDSSNLFWSLPHLLRLAQAERSEGNLAAATRHVDDAIEILTREDQRPTAGARLRWRRSLNRAVTLKMQLSLDQSDPAKALAAWRQFEYEDAGMMGFVGLTELPPYRPPDEGVVRLSALRVFDRYGIWLETADQLEFRWAEPPADELDRLAREFKRLCSDVGSSEPRLGTVTDALGEALFFADSSALVQATRVELRLSSGLRGTPLHIVSVDELGPLGLARPVAYLLTPRVWPNRLPTFQSALVVAASQLSPRMRAAYPALPGLEREAAEVARRFPQARILTGSQAQREAVVGSLHSQDVLHYAGHSFARGLGAALSLAPSPKGEELDVIAIRGRAPYLAFLAACATGESRELDTIAPYSVSHAFLRQGVSMTISALWDLDSDVATEAALAFYDQLRQTGEPDQALMRAAASIRDSGRKHPYYWSPYVLSL